MSVLSQNRLGPGEGVAINANELVAGVAGKLTHIRHDADTDPSTMEIAEVALFLTPGISTERRICLKYALRIAANRIVSELGIESDSPVAHESLGIADEALSGAVGLVGSVAAGSTLARQRLHEIQQQSFHSTEAIAA